MRRLLIALIFSLHCGPRGLPKMPPPEYEETPEPSTSASDAGASGNPSEPAHD